MESNGIDASSPTPVLVGNWGGRPDMVSSQNRAFSEMDGQDVRKRAFVALELLPHFQTTLNMPIIQLEHMLSDGPKRVGNHG